MAGKILVAYASNAGSTAEIAAKIGDHLKQAGAQVEVSPLSAVSDLGSYSAVIVGAPMIIGWHRGAVGFLKAHQQKLSQVPTAFFMTSLELTRTGAETVAGVPVYFDPKHGHAPKNAGKLSFKEKQTSESAYLAPVLNAVPGLKPVSVAFLGGALDYGKLGLLAKLFVKVIIRGKAGDYRNWDAVSEWAGQVRPALGV